MKRSLSLLSLLSLLFLLVLSLLLGPVPASAAPNVGDGRPVVAFIGDSWTAGVGATNRFGYAPRAVDQLGYDHLILGVGGSGYFRSAGSGPFRNRVAAALAAEPDVLVVQGSINDRVASTPQLRSAVWSTLGQVKRGKPAGTQVVVLGPSYVPGLSASSVSRLNNMVRSAATGLGFRFVDVAALRWSDPKNSSIWADPYHPNSKGHQWIADRLKPVLRSAAGA